MNEKIEFWRWQYIVLGHKVSEWPNLGLKPCLNPKSRVFSEHHHAFIVKDRKPVIVTFGFWSVGQCLQYTQLCTKNRKYTKFLSLRHLPSSRNGMNEPDKSQGCRGRRLVKLMHFLRLRHILLHLSRWEETSGK